MKAAVLFIVDSIGDEATPAEISRWLLRKSHSVSGLLDRMEKDRLITKTKNLHKKNLVRVTITEKGRKALALSLKRESINNTLSILSKEEQEQLYSSLEKVRDLALKEAAVTFKPNYPK